MRDLQRQVSRAPASLRQVLGEGFRFAAVGLAATSVYLAASLIASASGLTPYWANLAGYLSSVAVSYFGHATVTFRSSQPHRTQVAKFLLVSGFTYAMTNLIVFVVVDVLAQSFLAAALAVACSIPALTWLLARLWVFREV